MWVVIDAVIVKVEYAKRALAVTERVRTAIAALTVNERGATLAVSASVGVAAMPDHAGSHEDLIRAADQAAYAAKHAGKGRVSPSSELVILFYN